MKRILIHLEDKDHKRMNLEKGLLTWEQALVIGCKKIKEDTELVKKALEE